MQIAHPFPPVYDQQSKILILGSFPSVQSRKTGFYYGHPQNRFWQVISTLLALPCPHSIDEKKALLLRARIALWDAAASCRIEGSSDASMKNIAPTDLSPILRGAPIQKILLNGQTAGKIYEKLQRPITGMAGIVLPSTSPANAAWSVERLCAEWGKYIGAEQ